MRVLGCARAARSRVGGRGPAAPLSALVSLTVLTGVVTSCSDEAIPLTANRGSGGPVVTIAGDIATGAATDEATAKLVKLLDPDYVLTVGDHVYPFGGPQAYATRYEPSWGRFKSKTRPAPGNHDYEPPAGTPPHYYDYFARQLPKENAGRYYAFNLGRWRLYSLNCEIDCSASSPQVSWLRKDLATKGDRKHKLAYLHYPRYSCGRWGSSAVPFALWEELVAARTDVVLAGHDHNYQRFPRMDSSGKPFDHGPASFVVGTGGAWMYPFVGEHQGCDRVRYRQNEVHGVLEMTLGDSRFSWRFVTTDETVLDPGRMRTLKQKR